MTSALPTGSFYGTPPDLSDDILSSYLDFLEQRNGPAEGEDAFCRRDARMAELAVPEPDASVHIDPTRFEANYVRFDGEGVTADEVALLAFVKVNAAEAYGVEVMVKARAKALSKDTLFARALRTVAQEERYHTMLLVGAADHFEGISVTGAYDPGRLLKGGIQGLVNLPSTLYHPIQLGAEVGAIYGLNWLLTRVGSLFPNDPAVRRSMEERLIEVLIDEVGHAALNRAAVNRLGISTGKLAGAVLVSAIPLLQPEFHALGYDAHVRSRYWSFDYEQLPEEVRRKAFFV